MQVFAVPHNRSSQHPAALLHTHPSTPPPDGVRAPIPSPTAPVLPCGCGALFLLPGCACLRAVGVTVTRASTPVSQISAEPHWSFYIRSEQPRRAHPYSQHPPYRCCFTPFFSPDLHTPRISLRRHMCSEDGGISLHRPVLSSESPLCPQNPPPPLCSSSDPLSRCRSVGSPDSPWVTLTLLGLQTPCGHRRAAGPPQHYFPPEIR